MSKRDPSRHLGHRWEDAWLPYKYREYVATLGRVPWQLAVFEWDAEVRHFQRCQVCGYAIMAFYVLPEETLRFLGVPECDEFAVRWVMQT